MLSIPLAAAMSFQAAAPQAAAQDGFPLWPFYILLCVSLLLIVFIFLRNKDLRVKMNFLFSGAGRRMQSVRLKIKIRREREKRSLLLAEAGKNAWLARIEVRGIEREIMALAGLEEKLNGLHVEWHRAFGHLEELNRRRDDKDRAFSLKLDGLYKKQAPLKERLKETRNERKELSQSIHGAEKEIMATRPRTGDTTVLPPLGRPEQPHLFSREQQTGRAGDGLSDGDHRLLEHLADMDERLTDLQGRQASVDGNLAEIRYSLASVTEAIRRAEEDRRLAVLGIDREIQEAAKVRDSIQKTIVQSRKRMEPFFQAIGRAIVRERIPREDLDIFYIQFDEVERRIRELQKELDELT